ncbi:MAG: malate dehydrogenase [Actinomycetota bacterium]|nr:malate dehydrogenase [Actinomycetota bacterium]
MSKVSIFGAGHVGAAAAFCISGISSGQVNLIDVDGGKALGMALDIGQSCASYADSLRIEGSDDVGLIEESDIVVITAGFPRKPGMSRQDLSSANAPIISSISREIKRFSPDSVVIVVTNPVDEMTYLCWRETGTPPEKVMGMAGVLDTFRFVYFLSRLGNVEVKNIEAMVLGSHGDEMVPLIDSSKIGGTPLSQAFNEEILEEVIKKTRKGGEEIVRCLGDGSAFFAPAVSITAMVRAVLFGEGKVLPASVYLSGEYGMRDIFLGVPARLGRGGVTEVLELPLSQREMKMLKDASMAVNERISPIRAVYKQ